MEEDAGKSLHDRYPAQTAIDLNRSGVPLIEIVSEPDMRSSEEAGAYLRTLRQILHYLRVSDVSMGARIVLCDPHRALVSGPSKLRGATLDSPDIRAGMALLIAALCAEGRSTINNVGQIERGYERIDHRLRELGASVERVADRRR